MKHGKLPKLDLNVTNRCNFRCVHCAFDSGIEEMGELTAGEIGKILRDTKYLGGEKIDITGGEPTLRHDLEKIIRMGKSLDYRMELVTNGSNLGREELYRLKGMGLDSVAISLDGPDFETYRRIRGTDKKTYRKVLETIGDCVDMGFITKVNTVAFESNMESLPRIAEQCMEMGANENGIYYFIPVGRGERGGQKSIEPVKWLDFIREKISPYSSGIKVTVEFPLIEESFPQNETDCILKEDPYHLQILPDGNVYPCAILASYKKPAGNLRKQSVREIWEDEKAWDSYYRRIYSEVFDRLGGFCFEPDFDMEGYRNRGYRMVCPLRKFNAGDLHV